MAEQDNSNQSHLNRRPSDDDASEVQRQRGPVSQTNQDQARARERSMDDPTRGRQGDKLEEELPHGRSDKSDRMSER